MRKRTRFLSILLGLSVLLYLFLEVDWSAPGRYYRHYQRVSALIHREDLLKTAVTRLQERYGESASLGYSVTTDIEGSFTQTLQAKRTCGPVDDNAFLEDARRFFRDAGLGKVNRIEYLYGCDAPLDFGMAMEAFDQTLNSGLKEHSWCRQITTPVNVKTPGSANQVWTDKTATVLTHFSLDDDGLIDKGQWLDASTNSIEKEAQFRLMICMTRGAMRALEPSLSEAQIKALMSDIWFSHAQSASVAVGHYSFDSRMSPLAFEVKRVRKD
jgi:hypothetical protein